MGRRIDFTKQGGLRTYQDTLDFMQEQKKELWTAIKAHLNIPNSGYYIISGAEYNAAFNQYTPGIMVINGELMEYSGGTGAYVEIEETNTPTSYDNGSIHPNYFIRTSRATTSAIGNIAIASFTRRLLSTEFVQANEITKGIAEIATQNEVNAGIDDERIVTAQKLRSASFLPKMLTKGSVLLNITQGLQTTTVNLPVNVGTNNYIVLGSLNLDFAFTVKTWWTYNYKTNTSFQLITESDAQGTGSFLFDYLIIEK